MLEEWIKFNLAKMLANASFFVIYLPDRPGREPGPPGHGGRPVPSARALHLTTHVVT